MTSLMEAVGGDTFGGLSGFKRPTSSNPARVPSNLPAFRGVPNTPGSNIRSGPIKSSANHPDRKTNVTIPYARQTPLKVAADIGRVSSGDLVFVSRDRPGIPGYAHSRFTRLAGVDAMNRWMGSDNWGMKTDDDKYRYIAVQEKGGGVTPLKIADDWRSVPFLTEWSLDGVVLSNEEREIFYNDSVGQHDGQLYNIAIQGPCAVNNGFADEQGRGQVTQNIQMFAPGYMNHRVERVGTDMVKQDPRMTLQSDYTGSKYHLFPLQMFDRDIRPMNELFCGLVATQYALDDEALRLIKDYAAASNALKDARKAVDEVTDGERGAALLVLSNAEAELAGLEKSLRKPEITRAYQVWSSMGFLNKEGDTVTVKDTAPAVVYGFKWVLFTSAQAWELDGDIDIAAPNGYGGPSGKGARMKRQKLENDPWDQPEQRKEDMRHMVGAWRVGRVLDMKSAKMPWFEGGPMDTGFRCTTDVNIEWWDWRRLRLAFTNNPDAPQFADLLPGSGARFGKDPRYDGFDDSKRVTRWPTKYFTKSEDAKKNIPVNPFPFYKGNDMPLGDVEAYNAPLGKFFADDGTEVTDPNFETSTPPAPLSDDDTNPDSVILEFSASLYKLRVPKLVVVPPRVNSRDTAPHISRALAAISNLKLLLSPPDAAEKQHLAQMRSNANTNATANGQARGTQNGVAHFITAATASAAASVAPTTAPTTAPVAAPTAAPTATGSLSSSSSDSFDMVADIVAPTSTSAQVPSQPAQPAQSAQSKAPARKRAGPPSDVFAGIFGGSDSTMQPLNPAHRTDSAPSNAGPTGRSFARRGKGKDKE